ncbi:MAG TPA: hypothetical protein VMY37_20540 [Thermoguttaceae bacterium]|nr:hypothetical protein [Thermoguttaceae bacterium]
MTKSPTILTTCLAAVLAAVVVSAPAGRTVRADETPILIQGGGCRVVVSPLDGSLVGIGQTGREENILRSGDLGLWQIKFLDGSTLSATQFRSGPGERRLQCRHDPASNRAELAFDGPEASVVVTVVGQPTGVELVGKVAPRDKVVLDFSLPGRLRFDPADLERFISPLHPHLGIGAAFRPSFFQLQPADRPSSWEPRLSGTKGYERLFGAGLEMRDLHGPPVRLDVTEQGNEWLGPELAKRLDGREVNVSRPSLREQVDLVLLDSPNGPCLGASRLGGSGALWRWGGFVSETDGRIEVEAVAAVLRRLAGSSSSRGKLGLVRLARGPERGAGCDVAVSVWWRQLQKVSEAAGCELIELAGPDDMVAAARGDEFVAILNPYGERLPVPVDSTLPETVDAVGAYVRDGGHWIEVGGYPFFHALRPVRHLRYESPYPPLFADFFHVDAAGGSLAVYRVQPRTWKPWEGRESAEAIFVPGRLAFGGDEQGGWCERALGTYVKPGEEWQTPLVRLTAGKPAPENLDDYCRANAITRPLREKLAPAVFEKFRRAVLVKYQGTAREQIDSLDRLPVPTLIHFTDYLKGGFDKEYPDHLPPRPQYGTPAELRTFFDRAHALGHLMMPYTNPTWWCDHPRGPTFEREGEAPLLRGLDGKPSYERYARNDGWTITFWHPAVQAANRSTRRRFTEDYPVDVLLQDQCGARTWKYDLNPASPTPYAYTEGMLSMIAEDTRLVPLSTEDGFDRVVNAEAQLCGFTFGLVPGRNPAWARPMKSVYPPETWELFPVAQIIAHDKAAMLHHDLGKFVVDRPSLAWTLGLGFSMSYRVQARSLAERGPREWLKWLDRLQKSVCARYVGEPVRGFEHRQAEAPGEKGANEAPESDDGVIQATYGPVRVTANLGPTARTESGRVLPGYGFWAVAPGMIAANVKELAGADFGEEGVAFVTEGGAQRADIWIYAAADREVAAVVPDGMSGEVVLKLDGREPRAAAVVDGAVRFRLPGTPPSSGETGSSPATVPHLWHAEVLAR